MKPSAEGLAARQQYLTPDLFAALSSQTPNQIDYFTQTDDYPKTFRVGECSVKSDNETELQVLMLWRDDNRQEQKQVTVDAVKADGKWLINRVSK